MRFADLDPLGHVNNVTYLDYVAEARADLLAGHPAQEAAVRRHQVEFARPLVFRREPVLVDTWVTDVDEDSVTLAHEVYDEPAEPGGERTVYVRVATVLDHAVTDAERELLASYGGPPHAWRDLDDEPRTPRDVFPLVVRRSDVGPDGLASDVVFFEYFQEARVRYFMNLHTRGEKWTQHVVARTDLDYLAPVTRSGTSYAVHSWIGHLGTRSFTIRAELRDGEEVLATAAVVMVSFDAASQRPVDMAPAQRERLQQELG
jgi:acyl-CoA thioester hydrolase